MEKPETTDFRALVIAESANRAKYYWDHAYVRHRHPQGPDWGKNIHEVAETLHTAFLEMYVYIQGNPTSIMAVGPAPGLKTTFTAFTEQLYQHNGAMQQKAAERFAAAVGELHAGVMEDSMLSVVEAEFALGLLLAEIGRGEKAEGIFRHGIHFSRSTRSGMAARAQEAITDKAPPLPASPWLRRSGKDLPFTEIGGLRFLSHVMDSGRLLVTKNGSLVSLTDSVKAPIETQLKGYADPDGITVPQEEARHIADTPRIAQEWEALAKREGGVDLQEKLTGLKTKPIDGIAHKEAQQQLVCIDVDLLTGLRMDGENSELSRFLGFLKKNGYKDFHDFYSTAIPRYALEGDIEKQMDGLACRATGEDARLLVKAAPHLRLHLPRIYDIADAAFFRSEAGKITAKKRVAQRKDDRRPPRAYFTQGGSASGKSRLLDIAAGEVGKKNLVVASLDEVRPQCDQYWLYAAELFHEDDYQRFEQFAKTIRALTARRAREGGYDFYFDGSGTPFEGRYDAELEAFKAAGYTTTVLAAARPLYLPHRATLGEAHLALAESMANAVKRLHTTLRGVALPVLMRTHMEFPVSASDARRSPWVDRHILLDTSQKNRTVLSCTFDIDAQALAKLRAPCHDDKERGRRLRELLAQALPAKAVLPETDSQDVDFRIVQPHRNGYRIEIITDMRTYLSPAFVEKGLLYTQAQGPDALFQHDLAFDMSGRLKLPDGRLRLHYEARPGTQTINAVPAA